MTRKLSLKREALQELSTDELIGVAGGETTTIRETMFSCLTYISCNPLQCLPSFKDRCID